MMTRGRSSRPARRALAVGSMICAIDPITARAPVVAFAPMLIFIPTRSPRSSALHVATHGGPPEPAGMVHVPGTLSEGV